MDSLFQSLRSLEQILQAAGIESALIGGVAVAIWGEPRLTRNDRDGTRLDLLLADLPFDLEAISRAQLVKLSSGVSARVCTAED